MYIYGYDTYIHIKLLVTSCNNSICFNWFDTRFTTHRIQFRLDEVGLGLGVDLREVQETRDRKTASHALCVMIVSRLDNPNAQSGKMASPWQLGTLDQRPEVGS